jgi:hypothetical protein
VVAKAKFRLEGEDATAAAFRSALGNAQSTANRMQGLFRTAFAGISVAGIAAIGARAISMGDDLNKAAIKAGVTGKAISELSYAARQSDIELESLSTALKKMQVNLSQAGTGAKEPKEALAALGLQIRDLQGMKADRQFELLADRISKLKDPADRTRAAVQLFGKAGADLLPMFEEGAQGIRKAREEAERMGYSFGDEQLKKLAAADDAVKRLHSSWDAFWTAAVAKGAPAITGMLDLLSGARGPFKAGITGSMNKDQILEQFGWQIKTLQSGLENETPEGRRIKQEMIDELQGKMDRLSVSGGRGGPGRISITPGFQETANADLEGLSQVVVTAKKIRASWLSEMNEETKTSSRKEIEEYDRRIAALNQLRAQDVIDEKEYIDRKSQINEEFNNNFFSGLDEIQVRTRQVHEKILDFPDRAKEFARSAEQDFNDFFFDPVHHGIKGLGQDLLISLRHAIADGLTDKLFGTKASGGLGWGDAIFSGVKSLFGFANGGDFTVGGSGGTDSQLVAFRATPGEAVSIRTPGQSRNSAGAVAVHMHNDFRGATVDAVKYFQSIAPALVRQAIDGARMAVRDDLSRGAYA